MLLLAEVISPFSMPHVVVPDSEHLRNEEAQRSYCQASGYRMQPLGMCRQPDKGERRNNVSFTNATEQKPPATPGIA
jgi:hypothetical protein